MDPYGADTVTVVTYVLRIVGEAPAGIIRQRVAAMMTCYARYAGRSWAGAISLLTALSAARSPPATIAPKGSPSPKAQETEPSRDESVSARSPEVQAHVDLMDRLTTPRNWAVFTEQQPVPGYVDIYRPAETVQIGEFDEVTTYYAKARERRGL